jgi:hypothetical protein
MRAKAHYEDFRRYGIGHNNIGPAVRELEVLGFIRITERGRAGNAEYRSPSLYALTYLPPGTNDWQRYKTVFFSKSPTSNGPPRAKAWLERIAARKLDREPESKPQVAEAQLAALAKWGAIPATDRYLRKIKQRTLHQYGRSG